MKSYTPKCVFVEGFRFAAGNAHRNTYYSSKRYQPYNNSRNPPAHKTHLPYATFLLEKGHNNQIHHPKPKNRGRVLIYDTLKEINIFKVF